MGDAVSKFRAAEFSRDLLTRALMAGILWACRAFQIRIAAKSYTAIELDIVVGVWTYLVFDLVITVPHSCLINIFEPSRAELVGAYILFTFIKAAAYFAVIELAFPSENMLAYYLLSTITGHKSG